MDAPSSPSFSSLLFEQARGMAGWLKFVGVVTILSAIPPALTVFGMVVAWIPAWLGILLIQAGRAAGRGDERELLRMVEKLKTYFIVQGLLLLFAIAALLIMSMFFGAFFFDAFDMLREGRGPTLQA